MTPARSGRAALSKAIFAPDNVMKVSHDNEGRLDTAIQSHY
jgi:hypothetical protein